jgi:hypothetical protein
MGTPLEDLRFVVEAWDQHETRPEEVLARASTLPVAYAAFEAVAAMRPNRAVVLRQGKRVVARSGRNR